MLPARLASLAPRSWLPARARQIRYDPGSFAMWRFQRRCASHWSGRASVVNEHWFGRSFVRPSTDTFIRNLASTSETSSSHQAASCASVREIHCVWRRSPAGRRSPRLSLVIAVHRRESRSVLERRKDSTAAKLFRAQNKVLSSSAALSRAGYQVEELAHVAVA